MVKRDVLFIHGAGDEGYESDAELAASLRRELGSNFAVHYPRMGWDESAGDYGWLRRIREELDAIAREVVLVGHSLGGSMLLKYLSEHETDHPIAGMFLMSIPFWGHDEEWERALALRDDFADKLPKGVPVFLYHCVDDDVVDVSHVDLYARKLSHAIVRKIARGGHQLGNDLSPVARDIKGSG